MLEVVPGPALIAKALDKSGAHDFSRPSTVSVNYGHHDYNVYRAHFPKTNPLGFPASVITGTLGENTNS